MDSEEETILAKRSHTKNSSRKPRVLSDSSDDELNVGMPQGGSRSRECSESPIVRKRSRKFARIQRPALSPSSSDDDDDTPRRRLHPAGDDENASDIDSPVVAKKHCKVARIVSDDDDDSSSSSANSDDNETIDVGNINDEQNPVADEGEQCPICLDFMDLEKILQGQPESCAHTFCIECLQEWSKKINTCPIDRKEFNFIVVMCNGAVIERLPIARATEPLEETNNHLDNVCCQVCGRSDNEETLLLCDNCDNGYHCACLSPPLERVPFDSWYCPTCDRDRENWSDSSTVSSSSDIEPTRWSDMDASDHHDDRRTQPTSTTTSRRTTSASSRGGVLMHHGTSRQQQHPRTSAMDAVRQMVRMRRYGLRDVTNNNDDESDDTYDDDDESDDDDVDVENDDLPGPSTSSSSARRRTTKVPSKRKSSSKSAASSSKKRKKTTTSRSKSTRKVKSRKKSKKKSSSGKSRRRKRKSRKRGGTSTRLRRRALLKKPDDKIRRRLAKQLGIKGVPLFESLAVPPGGVMDGPSGSTSSSSRPRSKRDFIALPPRVQLFQRYKDIDPTLASLEESDGLQGATMTASAVPSTSSAQDTGGDILGNLLETQRHFLAKTNPRETIFVRNQDGSLSLNRQRSSIDSDQAAGPSSTTHTSVSGTSHSAPSTSTDKKALPHIDEHHQCLETTDIQKSPEESASTCTMSQEGRKVGSCKPFRRGVTFAETVESEAQQSSSSFSRWTCAYIDSPHPASKSFLPNTSSSHESEFIENGAGSQTYLDVGRPLPSTANRGDKSRVGRDKVDVKCVKVLSVPPTPRVAITDTAVTTETIIEKSAANTSIEKDPVISGDDNVVRESGMPSSVASLPKMVDATSSTRINPPVGSSIGLTDDSSAILSVPSTSSSETKQSKSAAQAAIADCCKQFLLPHYKATSITKNEYKAIMKKCVEKIYMGCRDSSKLNMDKVRKIVDHYVYNTKL